MNNNIYANRNQNEKNRVWVGEPDTPTMHRNSQFAHVGGHSLEFSQTYTHTQMETALRKCASIYMCSPAFYCLFLTVPNGTLYFSLLFAYFYIFVKFFFSYILSLAPSKYTFVSSKLTLLLIPPKKISSQTIMVENLLFFFLHSSFDWMVREIVSPYFWPECKCTNRRSRESNK